jgi:hypothetical protein
MVACSTQMPLDYVQDVFADRCLCRVNFIFYIDVGRVVVTSAAVNECWRTLLPEQGRHGISGQDRVRWQLDALGEVKRAGAARPRPFPLPLFTQVRGIWILGGSVQARPDW